MRQCLIIVILLASLLGIKLHAAEKAVPDNTSIQKATIFSIGPAGFAGTIAPAELATRHVLKQPAAEKTLLNLWKDASPAGRMYLLLGLKELQSKAFDEKAKQVNKSRDRVKFCLGGCMVSEEETATVVAGIQKGTFTLKENALPSIPSSKTK